MAETSKAKNTLKRVIVAFYEVPEFGPDSVEVPLVGNPTAEYAALDNAILTKHPTFKPGQLKRCGSSIELRGEGVNGFIEYSEGQTIRQIFETLGPDEVPTRQIGKVFFSGAPFLVNITYNAGGQVRVMLHPRLAGHSVVAFSNVISGQRTIDELPRIIDEVLGGPTNFKNLELQLRKVKFFKQEVKP